jgi:1,4-dihydroxy-2-naphthoyl-CoA hydrolase
MSQSGAKSPYEVPTSGFAGYIGVEWTDFGPDPATARIEVQDHHKQPYGIVHGGVYAALAESITSAATYRAVADDGMVAMGQGNSTTFLRPITEGTITAVATPRQRGKTTWVWDVELLDDDDRVCALVRMTIAVREQRS